MLRDPLKAGSEIMLLGTKQILVSAAEYCYYFVHQHHASVETLHENMDWHHPGKRTRDLRSDIEHGIAHRVKHVLRFCDTHLVFRCERHRYWLTTSWRRYWNGRLRACFVDRTPYATYCTRIIVSVSYPCYPQLARGSRCCNRNHQSLTILEGHGRRQGCPLQ